MTAKLLILYYIYVCVCVQCIYIILYIYIVYCSQQCVLKVMLDLELVT